MFSKEYIGAIVLVVVQIAKLFGLEIPGDALEGVITGIIAIVIAVSRFKKGDISILGKKA